MFTKNNIIMPAKYQPKANVVMCYAMFKIFQLRHKAVQRGPSFYKAAFCLPAYPEKYVQI